MTASLIASLLARCNRRVILAPLSPRFARHVTASLVASLLLPCKRLSLWRHRSLRFACHMTASLIASLILRRKRRVPVAPTVPSLRSSHDGVAHCFDLLALQTACACGAAGSFALLVTGQRCSLLRFSCLPTARACGAVGPFASLVTLRRLSLLRFSCVANGVCLWHRWSLCLARHMTASLIASLLLRLAHRACLWRRRSLCFARHMTA